MLDLSTVYVQIETVGSKKDPSKSKLTKGLDKDRFVSPEAKKLFGDALENYPILADPFPLDFQYPESCDYVGKIKVISQGGVSWIVQFGTGNLIQISKYQKVKGKETAAGTQTGVWMSGELTIYRICEAMQNHLSKLK